MYLSPDQFDEGVQRSLFKYVARSGKWIQDQTADNVDSIIFTYTNWDYPKDPISNRRNLIDLITDPVFKAPAVKTVETYAKNNLPTYLYQVHCP